MSRTDSGNAPRDHPRGKQFYEIVPGNGGTVDVFLRPEVTTYDTVLGVREYDLRVRVVRGVVPWDGLEDDIRARYEAWCAEAEVIDL